MDLSKHPPKYDCRLLRGKKNCLFRAQGHQCVPPARQVCIPSSKNTQLLLARRSDLFTMSEWSQRHLRARREVTVVDKPTILWYSPPMEIRSAKWSIARHCPPQYFPRLIFQRSAWHLKGNIEQGIRMYVRCGLMAPRGSSSTNQIPREWWSVTQTWIQLSGAFCPLNYTLRGQSSKSLHSLCLCLSHAFSCWKKILLLLLFCRSPHCYWATALCTLMVKGLNFSNLPGGIPKEASFEMNIWSGMSLGLPRKQERRE